MKKHLKISALLILMACGASIGHAAQPGGRPEERRPSPPRTSQPPRTRARPTPAAPAPRSPVEPVRRTPGTANAELTVTTDPPACSVYLNNRWIGETNADGLFNVRDLAPGRYRVTIRRSDYTSAERDVTIVSGRSEVIHLALSRLRSEATDDSEMIAGDVFNPPRPLRRDPPSAPPPRSVQAYRSPNGRFSLEYSIHWQAYPEQGDSVFVAPASRTFMREGRRLIIAGAMAAYLPVRGTNRMTLEEMMNATLNVLLRGGNEYLSEVPGNRRFVRLAEASAIQTTLTGYTPNNYTERVRVIVRPSDQGLIVLAFAAPESDFNDYEDMFSRIADSLTVSGR